uniref:PhoD-like phosphatase metallophosphatase domain-containing protein n=1 Tax=Moniliophthora roreri TaxID=221103 RepID=A0A0W0FWN5_MONRR
MFTISSRYDSSESPTSERLHHCIGYFNAYGYAAHNTTADIFIHLGEYIYEYVGNGTGVGRVTTVREMATIADYRRRLNQYRTDESLVCAHQHAPWVTVWDGKYGLDAWDGYKANRNRILDHLYKNQIDNTVILAGDSHANWVSDLAYPNDTTLFVPCTVPSPEKVPLESNLLVTSVTSGWETKMTPAEADTKSAEYVNSSMNLNLQWSEGHYRGFFTLAVDAQRVYTTFYSMKNHIIPNLEGFMIPDFIVEAWANKLNRPVAGGVGKIRAGALKVNGTS